MNSQTIWSRIRICALIIVMIRTASTPAIDVFWFDHVLLCIRNLLYGNSLYGFAMIWRVLAENILCSGYVITGLFGTNLERAKTDIYSDGLESTANFRLCEVALYIMFRANDITGVVRWQL